MRNPILHETLHAYAAEAAEQLAKDAEDGAEVPFELVEQPGARTSLFAYRPLTADFIRQRSPALGRLPAYARAAAALERQGGTDAYLAARGEPRVPSDRGERADAALRSFVASMYDGTSEFHFDAARFDRAYMELETMVFEDRVVATVLTPVLGLEIVSERLELGDGLELCRGDALAGAPAQAVWPATGEPDRPATLLVLQHEGDAGDGAAVGAARVRFRRILAALRLYEPGGFALGPGAWVRIDDGSWRVAPLGGGGRRSAADLVIAPEQEDEFRAFCNLIARRAPTRGEASWALARYEMACERVAPFEALTDHLLALRALLEPEGPASGRLAQRLAALCALEDDRTALAERVAHAVSLERATVAGIAPAAPDADLIAVEIGDHLRALLRDVLCGHLEVDLVSVADGILGAPPPAHASAPADAPPVESVTPPAGFVAVEVDDAPAPLLW